MEVAKDAAKINTEEFLKEHKLNVLGSNDEETNSDNWGGVDKRYPGEHAFLHR